MADAKPAWCQDLVCLLICGLDSHYVAVGQKSADYLEFFFPQPLYPIKNSNQLHLLISARPLGISGCKLVHFVGLTETILEFQSGAQTGKN